MAWTGRPGTIHGAWQASRTRLSCSVRSQLETSRLPIYFLLLPEPLCMRVCTAEELGEAGAPASQREAIIARRESGARAAVCTLTPTHNPRVVLLFSYVNRRREVAGLAYRVHQWASRCRSRIHRAVLYTRLYRGRHIEKQSTAVLELYR